MANKKFLNSFFKKGKFKKKKDVEYNTAAFLSTIEEILIKEKQLHFIGFGTFLLEEKNNRKTVKFIPSKTLDFKLNEVYVNVS